MPAGWGAPIYAKLDGELAAAAMSINAVKGVEIGDGFAAARLTGEQNADPMRPGNEAAPAFWPIMQAASPAAYRPASRYCCASRSSRPARS